MVGNRLRTQIDRLVIPLGRGLGRAGLSANMLTGAGAGMIAIAGWFIARGRLFLGGWILCVGALSDLFDGAVARATRTESRFGSFLDSTIDRVCDGILLSALSWHLASSGAASFGLALALGSLVSSLLTSYIKARAESLGFSCDVGLAERGERLALIAGGLLFGVLVPALGVLFVVSVITAIQRLAHVWRQEAG
ncbi:MAG: CDP-alcohol phosphatidyltransferase family protein [Actinomycetota bacterium]